MRYLRALLPTAALVFGFAACTLRAAQAQMSYGPVHAEFLADGPGIQKTLPKAFQSSFSSKSAWSLCLWFEGRGKDPATTVLVGLGNPGAPSTRYLGLKDGKATLWIGSKIVASVNSSVRQGDWHFLAISSHNGQIQLILDKSIIATKLSEAGNGETKLLLAPETPEIEKSQHFGGKIAFLRVRMRTLTEQDKQRPEFATVVYEQGSRSWPTQVRAQSGYKTPQSTETLPRSGAPFSPPQAKPLPPTESSLKSLGPQQWIVSGGWKLTPAPKAQGSATEISSANYKTESWWPATVPGTVLTTMVDRGIYPDPDYGLNNLAIPESLNKQDYWYRSEFETPRGLQTDRFSLTLNGINYTASVWLNGQELGQIKGAFRRGIFDVSGKLKQPGEKNVLAIKISPPPHPGIPHEQSIKAGPGENGGALVLDGPTFVATEGWDWIPGIRDRNTGLWQNVVLTATGTVLIGDPQVITSLPLPKLSQADVSILIPLSNPSPAPVQAEIKAEFDNVLVSKTVTLEPGSTSINLEPKEFHQLQVHNPRLWWPNGYGSPELYTLKLTASIQGKTSDTKTLTFGIREISYELSLYDTSGHLRRVEFSPAKALHQRLIDVTHEGMRETSSSWVSSLLAAGENSPAIRAVQGSAETTDLVIKVNGVRIACRGGNWGMDDARKRVSEERLEPYFRLHRDAHVNIIRNWVGQNTQQSFYDLADRYGLLVWNDFWASTQDYNLEPADPELFLENARDTILRYRNHPSIVLWCGRNEGVPQPILNRGLDKLIQDLDGSRYYSPSSNRVNLRDSGPYKYESPDTYYKINRGFSVELGVPSLPTLESLQSWLPKQDQWPINDVWAYHDWHQAGNGVITPFMNALREMFGEGKDLPDFERKAQMLNYVEHRAIFEGFNAHLWKPNSGRMLWMTQPAWPSTMWQILSSDYDTQASFYGVQKACEPLHIQLDLTNYQVDIINTTTEAHPQLTAIARLFSLDGVSRLQKVQGIDAAENASTTAFHLDIEKELNSGVHFLQLQLKDQQGRIVSDNFYWLAANNTAYRQLEQLPEAILSIETFSSTHGSEVEIQVTVTNKGKAVSLANKLTLKKKSEDTRILPAYYSDNYFSLLPGESRRVSVSYPRDLAPEGSRIEIRGWNHATESIAVTQ